MATDTAPVGVYGRPARAEQDAGVGGARRRTASRIGRAILIALIGVGIGYVLGRVQGGFAVRDLEAQLAEARNAASVQSTAHASELAEARRAQDAAERRAQVALQQAEARNRVLATSLELHRGAHLLALARTALDARNFGIAEDHLRDAESVLGPLTGNIPGLVQVVVGIAETRIVVAEDLERQRAALGALVEQMDDVLAAFDAQVAQAPTTTDGSVVPGATEEQPTTPTTTEASP